LNLHSHSPTSGFAESSESGREVKNSVLRQTLEWITLEGFAATVFIVLTGGAFLTGLALLLGAGDFEIGLLGAIPFLAQISQLVAALKIDSTGRKKMFTARSLFFARQVWWVLLPLTLLDGEWRLYVLMIVMVISSVAATMGAAGWMSWVADLVPGRIRGRYFGFRSAIVALSTVTATMIGGALIDHFRAANHESLGFSILIAVACIFGLGAFLLMKRIPENPNVQIGPELKLGELLDPLRDKRYWHLIKIFIIWNFALGISAVFFAAHMLTNLKMSFTQVSIYVSGTSIVAVLLNKPWGIVIDRFGSKPVITFCAFGISVIPLIWWFPRAGYLWVLVIEAVYSGALWAGFSLAAFNIPIAYSPQKNRTVYLAMFSVITGFGLFVASILGGLLAETWSWVYWGFGPQTFVNYHILFGISAVLRILGAIFIMGFNEPPGKCVPVMMQYMGESILKRVAINRAG